MADISVVSRLAAGIQRNVNLATNSLMLGSLKLTDDGGSTSTELTKTQLDTLLGGGDASSLHNHDGRYYTETELSSNANGEGASLIGIEDASSQFTATDVEGALNEALDAAQAAQAAIDAHSDGGASKHDASEIDVEASDGQNHSQADLETVIGELDDAIEANKSDVSDLRSTTGTSDGDTDMGSYGGSTLTPNQSVKTNIQELETAVDLRALDADVIKKDGSVVYTADQSMGGFKLTNLGAPVAASDAARLSDVQAASAGQLPKAPADLVSTSNITLSGEQTIDGVLTSTSRVLVAGQTNTDENGLYDTAAGAWTRATDHDGNPDGEVARGNTVLILSGTVNANTVYILSATDAADPSDISPGSDSQEWIIYSRAESITAGLGLSKTGLDLSVNVDDVGIEISGDALQLKDGGVTTAKIADDAVTAAKLAADVAGLGLSQAAGGELDVNVDDVGIEIDSDTLQLKDGGVVEAKIGNGAVTTDKLGADAVTKDKIGDDQVGEEHIDFGPGAGQVDASSLPYDNSTSGLAATDTQAAIDEVDARIDTLEGGANSLTSDETPNAALGTGLRAVRWGVTDLNTPETEGELYLADPTELSLVKTGGNKDPFHVIGLINSDNTTGDQKVFRAGVMVVPSHGLSVGEPCWLDNNGLVTSTPPSTAGDAAVKVGMIKDASTIDVKIEIMGVN